MFRGGLFSTFMMILENPNQIEKLKLKVILFLDHGADLTIDTDSFIIGDRIYVGGIRPGRITFIGETHFAPGEWAGVVLDDAEGKFFSNINSLTYININLNLNGCR